VIRPDHRNTLAAGVTKTSLTTFECRSSLKSGGSPIPVGIEARTIGEARKLIEAQYGDQYRSGLANMREVKK